MALSQPRLRGRAVAPIVIPEEAEGGVPESGDYPPLRVKNTFLEGTVPESPSLAPFYRRREVRSCPSKHVGRLKAAFEDIASVSTETPDVTPRFSGLGFELATPTAEAFGGLWAYPYPDYTDYGMDAGWQYDCSYYVDPALAACMADGTWALDYAPAACEAAWPPPPAGAPSEDAPAEASEPEAAERRARRKVVSLASALPWDEEACAEAASVAAVASSCSEGSSSLPPPPPAAAPALAAAPPSPPPPPKQEAAVAELMATSPPKGSPPGSLELPSLGSARHSAGDCKPCAFLHTKGCDSGSACRFCHLCGPEARKQRKKVKAAEKVDTRSGTKARPARRGTWVPTLRQL